MKFHKTDMLFDVRSWYFRALGLLVLLLFPVFWVLGLSVEKEKPLKLAYVLFMEAFEMMITGNPDAYDGGWTNEDKKGDE